VNDDQNDFYVSDHESGQEGDFEDKSCYSDYQNIGNRDGNRMQYANTPLDNDRQ